MEDSKYQTAVYEAVATLSKKLSGALAVEAKAGSGKTTTNVKSLEYVDGSMNIIEVAFNKSIAEELQRRVPHNVKAKTLNGLGFGTLMRGTGIKIEMDKEKTFNICTQYIEPRYYFMRSAICRVVGLLKNTAHLSEVVADSDIVNIMDMYDIDLRGKLEVFYDLVRDVWNRSIRAVHSIDFDDQLFLPIYMGHHFTKYDMIFGDEAQDWNRIQMLMIKECSDRIVFFGDTNQAIYGFRGADPHAMRNFIKELGATKLPLSICYRCSKSVIREAQKHVPDIEAWDQAPEGIVEAVKYKVFREKVSQSDFVLCRTTAPLVESCLQFIRDGVKATVRGKNIGEGLQIVLSKVCDDDAVGSREFYDLLQRYRMDETEKLERAKREAKIEALGDQCDTLAVFVEQCGMVGDIKKKINTIFSDEAVGLTHMTKHRSKGLETKVVWTLPSKPVKANKDWQKDQEINLQYVGITRAQNDLYFVEK